MVVGVVAVIVAVVMVIFVVVVRHAVAVLVVATAARDGLGGIILQDLDVGLHLGAGLGVGGIALVQTGEVEALGIDEVAHEDVGDGEAAVDGDALLHLQVLEEEDERALAVLARPDDLALRTLAREEGQEVVGQRAAVNPSVLHHLLVEEREVGSEHAWGTEGHELATLRCGLDGLDVGGLETAQGRGATGRGCGCGGGLGGLGGGGFGGLGGGLGGLGGGGFGGRHVEDAVGDGTEELLALVVVLLADVVGLLVVHTLLRFSGFLLLDELSDELSDE